MNLTQMRQRVPLHRLRFVFEKLDAAFTLGRIFGLLPVLILSHQMIDPAQLANRVANFQIALLISTFVLYAGPQVYLIKQGRERHVFLHHMIITTGIITFLLLLYGSFSHRNLIAPFLFLVASRTYYLMLTSYFKLDVIASILMIIIATITLAIFFLTASYWAATIPCTLMTTAIMRWKGYTRPVYFRIATRKYFTLIRDNASYFLAFLMQQQYTHIVLAVYAFMATGKDYLIATHVIYLYAFSFIFHGIAFRFFLHSMSRIRQRVALRASLIRSLQISVAMGITVAVTLFSFSSFIEKLFFNASYLDKKLVTLLCVMICLNSLNFGWASVFLSERKPLLLATISAISAMVVIIGIFVTDYFKVENGIFIMMIIGLAFQASGRTYFGSKILKDAKS